MARTLHQRLGCAERFASILARAVDRRAASPVLASRRRGTDLPLMKRLALLYLSAGYGGPPTDEEVNLRDLRAAASDREIEAIVGTARPLRPPPSPACGTPLP